MGSYSAERGQFICASLVQRFPCMFALFSEAYRSQEYLDYYKLLMNIWRTNKLEYEAGNSRSSDGESLIGFMNTSRNMKLKNVE